MRRRWKTIAVSSLVTFGLALTVWAASESEYFSTHSQAFRSMDLDQNGQISTPELELTYGSEWSETLPLTIIDINEDGLISYPEYHAWKLAEEMKLLRLAIAVAEEN